MPLQLRLKGISCLPWKSLEVIVSGLKAAFITAALCIMAASPAFAAPPPDRGPTPGLGWGPGGKGISVPGPVAGVDRKSTRLNSSHVKISYAVFCLKKKKERENRRRETRER